VIDRRNKIKSKYGISLEDYSEILRRQGEGCAICGLLKPTMHVDHCHDTGQVRGVLCGTCNPGIGLLGDNIQLLESAIRYLTGRMSSGGNET
jgi:hypothetical protein